jgi:hypothetical protein
MFDFLPSVWNGTLREHYLLLFGVAGSIGLVAGLAGAWFGARFGTRRVVQEMLERLPNNAQQQLANEQLFQLSQAVDTLSVEMERLAEGQRYAAKLLADRSSRNLADRPAGVITPH